MINSTETKTWRPSARGDLRATSIGETYPWTVQPRVRVEFVGWHYELGFQRKPVPWLGFRRVLRTVWVAFNALTGFESAPFGAYEGAAAFVRAATYSYHRDVGPVPTVPDPILPEGPTSPGTETPHRARRWK